MEDSDFWLEVLVDAMMYGIPSIFIVFGGWMLIKAHRFMGKARRTTGTVVEVETTIGVEEDNRRREDYTPVLEYTASDGTAVRAKTFATLSRKPVIGHQMEILTDPETPDIVRVPGFMNYGFGAIAFAIGAAALVAVLSAHLPT